MFEFSKSPEEVLELKEKIAQIHEKNLDTAKKVVKITEMEEWKTIAEFLETLKKDFSRTPEEYFENEKLIGIDTGARSALTLLTQWITSQSQLIDKAYGQKK